MIYQHRCHFYCLKGRHNSSSSTDDVHEAGAVCLHDKLWMRLCLQNSTTIRRSLQARTLLNLTESSSPSVTFLFMAYDSRQIWGFNSVSATGKLCRCKCYADVGNACQKPKDRLPHLAIWEKFFHGAQPGKAQQICSSIQELKKVHCTCVYLICTCVHVVSISVIKLH